MKKKRKAYWEMTTAELREATKEFDADSANGHGFKPLTAKQRKQWNTLKRRRGRPKVGRGAMAVLISIERGLLNKADDFAERKKLSRSELIARSLQYFIRNPKGLRKAS